MYTRKGIRMIKKGNFKKFAITCLAGTVVFIMTACGNKEEKSRNLVTSADKDKKVVNLFGPMEKSNPDADNMARWLSWYGCHTIPFRKCMINPNNRSGFLTFLSLIAILNCRLQRL